MAVYQKIDSSTSPATIYLTNEEKEGYTLRPDNNRWTAGKNVIIELYDDKFILPSNSKLLFYYAANTTFNDMDKWDWSEVENASAMFASCEQLTSLDFSTVDTWLNLKDMSEMFEGCSSLTNLDLHYFTTRNVTDMSWMFDNCTSLVTLNLSRWNTSKVKKMANMFHNCSALRTILVSIRFEVDQLTDDGDGMFTNCDALVGGNGTPYSIYNTNKDYAKIDDEYEDGYFTKAAPADVYYKIDGDNIYYTNENKAGYTKYEVLFNAAARSRNKQAIVELTNGRFVFPELLKNPVGHYMETYASQFEFFIAVTNSYFPNSTRWDTGEIRCFHIMFSDCPNLLYVDMSNFDTGGAESIYEVFTHCPKLVEVDFRPFDFSNIKKARYPSGETGPNGGYLARLLYYNDGLKTVYLPEIDLTNAVNADGMFAQNPSLEHIYAPEGTDFSIYDAQWDSWVGEPQDVFRGDVSLENWDGTYGWNHANNTTPIGYFGVTPREYTKYDVYEKVSGAWKAVNEVKFKDSSWIKVEVYK